jgi:hypothetical protein
MPRWQVQHDLPQWQQLLAWLAARRRPTAASASAKPDLNAAERPGRQAEPAKVTPLATLTSPPDRELDVSA